MAVTPNYGWPVPVATDYVKDGWEAISDLGNAIDTTVAGLKSGLTLVKTQTIGTTVATVNVSSAFSSTYQNYRITLSGVTFSDGSYTNKIWLKMFDGTNPANTNYTYGTVLVDQGNGSLTSDYGTAQTTGIPIGRAVGTTLWNSSVDLYNPFSAAATTYHGITITNNTNGYGGAGGGIHTTATSYSGFQILLTNGTMTGGTIRVYGYQNS